MLEGTLSTDIGGEVEFSIDEWINDMQKAERNRNNRSNEANSSVGDGGEMLDENSKQLFDDAGEKDGQVDKRSIQGSGRCRRISCYP